MNSPHRMAFWLSLLPMMLGGAVLGLWLLTDWSVWMYFGLPIILLGVVATIAAALLLVAGWRQAMRERTLPVKQIHLRTLLVALLMLSNYPAALAAFAFAVDHWTRYTVVVVNDADTPWAEVAVAGGGIHHAFGTVAPHTRARCDFWFGDGELVLTWRSAVGTETRELEEYVTGSLGGHTTVVRRADATTIIERRPR